MVTRDTREQNARNMTSWSFDQSTVVVRETGDYTIRMQDNFDNGCICISQVGYFNHFLCIIAVS